MKPKPLNRKLTTTQTDNGMLRINIAGEDLDLKPNMTFEYNIKNPFFEDDTIPVASTYTFSVPPTARNSRILAYPLRINQKTRLTEFNAEIVFGSISIARGIIVRKKAKQRGDISLYFKAQTPEDLLDLPLCDLPLKEYDLSSGDYLENIIALCESAFEGNEPFALPMVRIKEGSKMIAYFHKPIDSSQISGFWASLLNRFMKELKVSPPSTIYLNPYYVYAQTLAENNKYYSIKPIPTRRGYGDALAPFPYLWHIMEKVLESMGISENPFYNDSDLRKIIVSATYNPTKTVFADDKFRVNKSLSTTNTGDFVKEVLKAFGYTLNRINGKTSIVSYDEILTQTPLADWSDIILDGWVIEEEKQQNLEAGMDTGINEFTMDDSEEKILTTVTRPYQMMYKLYLMAHNLTVDGVGYERSHINKTCWFIESSKEYYYSEVDEESKRFWVTFKGVALDESEANGLPKKNRRVNMKIPAMIVDYSADNFAPDFTKEPVNGVYSGEIGGFEERFMYLPYIDAKRNDRDFDPTLLCYLGHKRSYIPVPLNDSNVAPNPRYPFATTNACTPTGTGGLDFSKIEERSSVAKSFFSSKRLKLKGKVLLNERQIHLLTGVDVIVHNGKRWLLKEISIPIKPTRIEPSEVTLVEIPDIATSSLNLSFGDWDLWA